MEDQPSNTGEIVNGAGDPLANAGGRPGAGAKGGDAPRPEDPMDPARARERTRRLDPDGGPQA